MDLELDAAEVRVLGALVEKEITTPDYYPLSLNALLNACNQKSNRDPVVSYDEDTVAATLDSLRTKGLVMVTTGREMRVAKYSHRLSEVFNFDRREMALLCVLMLRGPQTPGELRGRAERMYRFDDLAAVEASLNRLMERQPPVVKPLPRQPGFKEIRYTHLLSGEVETPEASSQAPARRDEDRLSRLEAEIQHLRDEVADLRRYLNSPPGRRDAEES